MAILRIVESKARFSKNTVISLFDGDIEKDRKYWKKDNAKARYFELKELLL